MLPLVIRIKGLEAQASKEKQYVFTSSPVRIGRNQLNDISIPKPFVSLFHALVRFDKNATYVVDLGSTNGVNIDGRRIEKNVPTKVGEGTRVTIGSIEMRLSRDASAVGDGQSRMTQFRALASLTGDGVRAEALSFKPTPVQEREEAVPTAHFSALDVAELVQARQQQQGEGSPRTIQVAALQNDDLEPRDEEQRTIISSAPSEEAPKPAQPAMKRHRTLTSSVRVVPPGTGGVQGSIQQLVPLYTAYRNAWQALQAALVRNAAAVDEADRAQLISQLQQRMPGLVHEPQFDEFVRSLGLNPPSRAAGAALAAVPGPGNRLDVMARELLGQFVRSYLPGSKGLESGADIDRFLDRLAEVLETFGRAFVELRQGHDQFGQEMAVTTGGDVTPLTKAKSTREVLRYLLDWKAPNGAQRVQELMGGFVDVMIHQIALLNGMREGVKDMLQTLSPGAAEEGGGGVMGLLGRLWPFGASRRLKLLEERVRTLVEEERELTAVLFGPEFAKAYLAIVGDAANKGGPGEAEDSAVSVSRRRARES